MRLLSSLAALSTLVPLAGCAPSIDVTRVEDAPRASILVPTDGSVVRAGRIELRGRASDPQDPPERLFAVWSLGDARADADGTWEDVCSGFADKEGALLCVTQVRPEHTQVRLLVKDVPGFEGRAFVDLVVSDAAPPTVRVLEPEVGTPAYADLPIRVVAEVADADHPVTSLDVRWYSHLDGRVDGPEHPDRDGRLEGAVRLSEGTHRLTVTVTDPDEQETTAAVTLRVRGENTPPTVRLDVPAQGQGILVGTPVDLLGFVTDAEASQEDVQAHWSSDRDGPLGTVSTDRFGWARLKGVVLSEGDHVLTLAGEDEVGGVAEDHVTVHVDTPPAFTWDTPEQGATLPAGTPLHLDLTASDARTPPEALVVHLASHLTGEVLTHAPTSEGRVSVHTWLEPGTHELTLTVTDALGLSTFEVRTITVEGG